MRPQGAHFIPILFYWVTTIFLPLLNVATNLDANIVVDSGMRAIAAALPDTMVAYVYPTLSGGEAASYEYAPLDVEYVYGSTAITSPDAELKAVTSGATANSTSIVMSSSLPAIASTVNAADTDDDGGFAASHAFNDLRHPLMDYVESFGIPASLFLLTIYVLVELLMKLFRSEAYHDEDLDDDALVERQAEWGWRLKEQLMQLWDYDDEASRIAVLVEEWEAENERTKRLFSLGGMLYDRVVARADTAKEELSAVTAIHVERETIRQRGLSTLRAFSDHLSARLAVLYDRFETQRRDATTRQERDDERILCLREQIDESQIKVEVVVEHADNKAAEAISLTTELIVLRSEVAGLTSGNEALHWKVASLEEAIDLRQQHREDELQVLQESLLSKQAEVQLVVADEETTRARVAILEAELGSTLSAARETEEQLEADYEHKRQEIAALTNTVAVQAATTHELVTVHAVLQSAHAENTSLMVSLTSRITATRNYLSQLYGNLTTFRQIHQDEITTLTAANNALRASLASAAAAAESAQTDLARAQAKQDSDVASAQSQLEATRADHQKTISALETKVHKQANHIDSLERGSESLKQQVASVDDKRNALEACFEENELDWADRRDQLDELEAQHKHDLDTSKGRWAELEEKRLKADAKEKEAQEAALEAENKAKADRLQLKTTMTMFQMELDRLRAANGRLVATQSTLQADYEAIRSENEALQNKLAEIPATQDTRLDDLTVRVEATEAARDAKNASRDVSPAIRQRTTHIENAKDTVEVLKLTTDALETKLSEMHGELHHEKQKLDVLLKAREGAERKVMTLRALLATPTPSLTSSSGCFERSPSLTPPPQTPVMNVLSDLAIVGSEDVDVVDSPTISRLLYKA